MLVSDFDYDLPERLIAQEPATDRDSSRLLVVDRASGSITDSTFSILPSLLRHGDVLVLNNTRVFPARLIGNKVPDGPSAKQTGGGRIEIFLVCEREPLVWEALVRPGRGLMKGARVEFAAGELKAEVVEWLEGGRRLIRFEAADDFDQLVDQIGRTPLPPYIKRDQDTRNDAERYQTVYASERGAIAAPTAGLHFTGPLLDSIKRVGVEVIQITLHVGYGTFQPVRAARVEDHRVEPERYTITETASARLDAALNERRRIIAVGTTTTRALESSCRVDGPVGTALLSGHGLNLRCPAGIGEDETSSGAKIRQGSATTALFIYPGFKFCIVGGLITNFHLPQSSLLMLVSAFGGRDLILEAYRHAVESEYRFYSYGDAMLVL